MLEGGGRQRTTTSVPAWETELGTDVMGVIGASFRLSSPPWCKELCMKRLGEASSTHAARESHGRLKEKHLHASRGSLGLAEGQNVKHPELEQNEIAATEPLTISASRSLPWLLVGFNFPSHCVPLHFVGKTCWTRGNHLRKSISHRQALRRKQITIREAFHNCRCDVWMNPVSTLICQYVTSTRGFDLRK